MSHSTDPFARLDDADVIFVAQDGHRLAPARVRCYQFAAALTQRGLRCEVVSFFDHLGAPCQGGAADGIDEAEKLRLNLRAFDGLSRNPRALLYMQKIGYHTLAVMLAAARNGNPYILDYDDYDLDGHPFRSLERYLPSLAPEPLLTNATRAAAACVASSHRIFDLIRPYNPNTHLIHTVADPGVFAGAERERPRNRFGDTVNILWGGDVWGDIPMRDILFAVDAFALMPAAIRSRARFHLVAFGHAWEELKRRIGQRHPDLLHSDPGAIVLHERIQPAEFGAVLREMDVGVLPYADNRFNAFKSPTKMFEYLLAKVTVCATPVGEVTHCLSHGETALFAKGLTGYSAALAKLVDDDDLRRSLADAAYTLARDTYTLDAIAPRLEAIIRQVIAPADPEGAYRGGESAEAFVARRLGRSRRLAPRELSLARQDLLTLAVTVDRDGVDPRRWSAPLLALLEWPGLVHDTGLDPSLPEKLRRDGQRLRYAARLRPEIRLPRMDRPAGPPALCKLAAAEDWDDPAWFAWAARVKIDYATFLPENAKTGDLAVVYENDFLNLVSNYFKRSRGFWARAHLLYGLERLGKLGDGIRASMICDESDNLYLTLTEWVEHVRAIDLSEAAAGNGALCTAGATDPWLLRPRLFDRHRISIDHAGPAGLEATGPAVDVALGVRDVVSRIGVAAFLAWARRNLKPDGVAAFAVDISLNGQGSAPSPEAVARIVETSGEWACVGRFDGSLSDATLDRLVVDGSPHADNPHFVRRVGDALLMPTVWFVTPRWSGRDGPGAMVRKG